MKEGMRIEEAKNALLDFYPYDKVMDRSFFAKEVLRDVATRLMAGVVSDINGKTGKFVRYSYPFMAIARRAPIEETQFWPRVKGEIVIRLDLLYAPFPAKDDAWLTAQYAPEDTHAHIVFLEEHDPEEVKNSPFMRLWRWLTSTEEETK
jgi:hypothetical protein